LAATYRSREPLRDRKPKSFTSGSLFPIPLPNPPSNPAGLKDCRQQADSVLGGGGYGALLRLAHLVENSNWSFGPVKRFTASRLVKFGISIPLATGSLWLAATTVGLAAAESSDFMPHGYCYLWNPWIVWLHVLSDGLITLSYYCIPVILIYFIRENRDLPFNRIFWMFGGFILACGTTHLMEIWNVWHGNYMVAGIIKAVTAAVSVVTAAMLVPLAPQAMALPGLQRLNRELEEQAADRELAEQEPRASFFSTRTALKELHDLRQLNEELEEKVLQRTAELATANQELEAFAYSVSHDLRAPLRHIGGFSKILMEDFGPTMAPEAVRHLERIEEGTRRMGRLVDELLNLARVGRHTLKVQNTGLNSLIAEVISMLQLEVGGRSVTWKIAELPSAQCDPILMKQVFQNLIANALKFTRPREQAVIEISQYEENGQTVFGVRDNGVGFNMKYSDKLFGVFQRLHRVEDFEGTGVGLATVQRIVHKHGGQVWAEAELDKGAAFFFTLEPIKGVRVKAEDVLRDEAKAFNPREVESKSAAAGRGQK
jgi:signal transduction histidine kinase